MRHELARARPVNLQPIGEDEHARKPETDAEEAAGLDALSKHEGGDRHEPKWGGVAEQNAAPHRHDGKRRVQENEEEADLEYADAGHGGPVPRAWPREPAAAADQHGRREGR